MKETAAIMGKVKLDDNRRYGDTAEEKAVHLKDWHDKIGDLDFQDAWAAVVTHTRDSTEYLKASHIRAGVKRIQAGRDRQARIDSQLSRTSGRAITGNVVTLDRAKFEADTQAAIAAHRAGKS